MTAQSVAPLDVLPRHALKQLKALGYQDGDRVCLRAFLPEKGKAGHNADFVYPDLPTEQLLTWGQQRRGAYFVVNAGGHKDADIEHCKAVFFEYDEVTGEDLSYLQELCPGVEFPFKETKQVGPKGKTKAVDYYSVPKEIQQGLWVALGLPEPTCQVDTGGKSIHSYWAFAEGVDPEVWRSLQTDLLNHAHADRTLKNPSRVMRLAGCRHAETGEISRIVGGNGQAYSYQSLRECIPSALTQDTPLFQPQQQTWTDFERSFRLPVDESVPLDICLSRDSRELLANGVTQNRNDNGAKLARDLIGTGQQLRSLGQRFDGDPYSLFISYCQRCPAGDGWAQREWDSVWKSAESSKPGASLAPDLLENCIKSWVWKYRKETSQRDASLTGGSKQDNNPSGDDENTAEKLKTLVQQYASIDDDFERELIGLQIKRDYPGLGDRGIQRLLDGLLPKKEPQLLHTSEFATECFNLIEARAEGTAPTGIPSGFYDLDKYTQGFQRSDLIIVAARPSMGKSAFANQVALSVAQTQGLPCMIYSLEMSRQQVLQRMWALLANIDSTRLKTGQLSPDEWPRLSEAVEKTAEMDLFIDDAPNLTVHNIETTLKAAVEKHGKIGPVIIDYLQLMGGTSDNRVQELARITRSLKVLARETDTPIIALSQLSRGVESRTNKRPQMADLRESGGLEQDADLILMLYREEYYDPETPDRGIAEIGIKKHRNGATGTVKLLFEPQYTRFRNLAN